MHATAGPDRPDPADRPEPTHPIAHGIRADLDTVRQFLLARFPLVNDHPDVAGLLRDAGALATIGPALAAPFVGSGITAVASPEARGPILGALVAVELGAGLVLIRKDPGNHPGADRRMVSGPTWRGPVAFQARSFDLTPDDRVLVVDDWITTGSSIRAVVALVEATGATVVGTAALVDKTAEGGGGDAAAAEGMAALATHTLLRFDDIVANSARPATA